MASASGDNGVDHICAGSTSYGAHQDIERSMRRSIIGARREGIDDPNRPTLLLMGVKNVLIYETRAQSKCFHRMCMKRRAPARASCGGAARPI